MSLIWLDICNGLVLTLHEDISKICEVLPVTGSLYEAEYTISTTSAVPNDCGKVVIVKTLVMDTYITQMYVKP